jgi:hypothetical protein
MKAKKALWAHNFVASGLVKEYAGRRLEACGKCGWPHDEHPDHPSRKPDWRWCVLPDGHELYWSGSRKSMEKYLCKMAEKKP